MSCRIVMWCSMGFGLSGPARVSSAQEQDTRRPDLTSWVVCATRSGVIRLSAPRSSAVPHLPQFLHASYVRVNSAAETAGDEGLAAVIGSVANLVAASRLLEQELRLVHPFLLAADRHVNEGEDSDGQHRNEHHQPIEDWAGARERGEVGLPDDHHAGGRRD